MVRGGVKWVMGCRDERLREGGRKGGREGGKGGKEGEKKGGRKGGREGGDGWNRRRCMQQSVESEEGKFLRLRCVIISPIVLTEIPLHVTSRMTSALQMSPLE